MLLITVLTGCAKINTFLPDPVSYPCAQNDQAVTVTDDDSTKTGFSASEAVDFIDGFRLVVTYDPEQSADTSVDSETVTLSVTRTGDEVSFVDRTEGPLDVMGPLPGGKCLLGPMLRIPLTVRWPMRTPDGDTAFWESVRTFEVGSIDDPARTAVFVDVDYLSTENMEPQLAAYVETFLFGKELSRAALTAWGTLAGSVQAEPGQAFGITIEPDHGDDTGIIITAPTVRVGDWVAAD